MVDKSSIKLQIRILGATETVFNNKITRRVRYCKIANILVALHKHTDEHILLSTMQDSREYRINFAKIAYSFIS